jgi:site-specific DNA-methyltransferase (adenine-specific)
MTELNQIIHADCIDIMKDIPDKFFELAIVDPPYGIGAGSVDFINGTSKTEKTYYKISDWDTAKPDANYFMELFRVSQNQIICGGNYFIDYLKSTRGFICWDKTIHGNSYADCEFLWTSFDRVARIFRKNICEVTADGRFHPTQKPVALYKWLLKNYAKTGDKILDTHAGSCSSVVACIDYGFEYLAIEKDKDYYEASLKRIDKELQKIKMF